MSLTSKPRLIWLWGSCLLVLCLALLFSHAPQPFKRLGLFYACFGMACGVVLSWFSRERGVQMTRGPRFFTMLLVVAGGVLIGWNSFRDLQVQRAEQLRRDPQQLAMLNMLEKVDDADQAAGYQQRRRQLQPQFVDYLAFRVSRLGNWESPWPLLFWMGELSVAASLAGWIIGMGSKVTAQSTGETSLHDLKEDE